MNRHSRAGKAAILVLTTAFLIACSDTADVSAETQAIQNVSNAWLDNIRERNAAAVAANFAPDGIVLNAGSRPVAGPDAIGADIAANWAVNPDFTIDWQSLDVSIAKSGDMAWERGRWTFDADGDGPAAASSGEFITVFEKVDGEWKVVVDIGVPTAGD
jgi:uncharacterized protein (TIGR02246 family)